MHGAGRTLLASFGLHSSFSLDNTALDSTQAPETCFNSNVGTESVEKALNEHFPICYWDFRDWRRLSASISQSALDPLRYRAPSAWSSLLQADGFSSRFMLLKENYYTTVRISLVNGLCHRPAKAALTHAVGGVVYPGFSLFQDAATKLNTVETCRHFNERICFRRQATYWPFYLEENNQF